MGLLEGQRAVVTGGASGIGRATARRMAEEGAAVAVVDINGEAAGECAEAIGGTAHMADVTDPEAMRDAFDAAAVAMGGITTVFNNAGIGGLSPLFPTCGPPAGAALSPPPRSVGPVRLPAKPPTPRPRPAWLPSRRRPPSSTRRPSGSTPSPRG
jgi:NAD(P)-dependent dehydrogenase (short-subunit alcohol dehydrogenase family)